MPTFASPINLKYRSEAVVGEERFHVEMPAWLCLLLSAAVTLLSEADACSPREVAMSPTVPPRRPMLGGQRDRPGKSVLLPSLGTHLWPSLGLSMQWDSHRSRGPLGISRVSVLRLQKGNLAQRAQDLPKVTQPCTARCGLRRNMDRRVGGRWVHSQGPVGSEAGPEWSEGGAW